MATGATTTQAAAFLKRMYSPKFVLNTIAKQESRGFNLAEHRTDGGGDSYNFPNMYGENPSGSALFSDAQERAQATGAVAAQFRTLWMPEYSLFTVSGALIAQSRNNAGAWMTHLKLQTDSALRMAMHRKSVAFYTSGWGELGRMSNAAAGNTTLTLSNKSHVYRFMVGMKLVFSSTLNTAALRAGTAIVVGVDYNAGSLTLDANTNAISGLAQNDWIFTSGDRESSVTPTKRRMTGFGGDPDNQAGVMTTTYTGEGWLPSRAPAGGDSFFGVNRSNNSFLWGNLIDVGVTPMGLAQAVTQGLQTASSIGNGTKFAVLCSPANFTQLANSIQGQRQYTEVPGRGGVSFKTILFFADGVEAPLISDKYCPDEMIYGVDRSGIEYVSCGAAPSLDDNDGKTLIKQASDDGVEGRWNSYETLALRNQGACFQIRTRSTT
jgi:hypothetical protein